jgi:hypothetical protein
LHADRESAEMAHAPAVQGAYAVAYVKRIVLDVLKPHHPNALEFAVGLAALGPDYRVALSVAEVDEQTETLVVEIDGDDIDFQAVTETIAAMGGSVHSIDEVAVHGQSPASLPT